MGQDSMRRLLHDPLGTAVARFGTPLVIGMVLHTSFNLIDMYMISRLENASPALAALGMCDMIAAAATILANGVATATVAVIARASGARDRRTVRRTTWQSLLLTAYLSVAFGLLGIFGSDFIIRDLMAAKGETADLGAAYLQVVLGGCFGIFFLLQVTSILRALGHAKAAALLLVSGNALNIVLNVFFIYGTGPHPDEFAWAAPLAEALGVPRFGVMGTAYATLIGRTIPVVIGLLVLFCLRGGPRFRWFYLRHDSKELMRLIRIGWPASAQLVLRIFAILVLVGLINATFTTATDQDTLSAYSICLRLETMALFIGMGWGAAASTFVGTNLGANRAQRAKDAGWIAAVYNLGFMLALAVVYILYSDSLVSFFDATPSVVAAGRSYLTTVAFSYGLLGVGLVLSQAMSGAGATRPSFIIDCLVVLGLILPAALVVTHGFSLPPIALWTVIAIGNGLNALAFLVFYARGSFLRTSVS